MCKVVLNMWEWSGVELMISVFFFSSRRRHTRCALVTGVQTCALPIFGTGNIAGSMSDGEGKLAPRRHFTPSAYIAPIDPNTDRSLQRRTRTILRPRPPHIAARLAGIGSIAFRSANL